jgi:hypothetical protein
MKISRRSMFCLPLLGLAPMKEAAPPFLRGGDIANAVRNAGVRPLGIYGSLYPDYKFSGVETIELDLKFPITPEQYEEIPELTEQWFEQAVKAKRD